MTGDDHGRAQRIRMARAETAALAERFPGVPIWFGEQTMRYWALVNVEERTLLIEADRPDELADAILRARMWPWP